MVTFIVGSLIFLVGAIAYAIISYITAVIVCLIDKYRMRNRNRDDDECFDLGSCNQNRDRECGRNRERMDDLLTISNSCQCDNNGNRINARVNVIPNSNTNGRTGCFCGNYRRR